MRFDPVPPPQTERASACYGWAGALVLLAIALGLWADAWLRLTPGPFSIDEVTYHQMAKNAAAGRLFIWNGYEELPSPELQSLQIRATAGGLSAQYPQGYAFLAAPLIAAFGYFGLFLLNALAFLATAASLQRLAFAVLKNARWAALATSLWAFASYSWDYALAVWPHSVAVLAVVVTADLAFAALGAPSATGAFKRLMAAGLACGLGMTVRLDVALCAVPLLVPLLFRGSEGLRLSFGFVLGLIPGAALLSGLNLWKWGSLVPLSYGSAGHDAVVPWSLASLGVLACLAVQQRQRILSLLGKRGALLAAFALISLSLLWPATRQQLFELLNGVFALVVDSAALPIDPGELAIQRRDSGAVSYMGTLKKGLLQSCPAVSVSLAAFIALARHSGNANQIWLLAGTPLTYIGFYGASAWHGGMCFNMRYLLPLLPFAAIAMAVGLRALAPSRLTFAVSFGAGVAVALAAAAAVARFEWSSTASEAALLAWPLILSALLGVGVLLSSLRPSRGVVLPTLLLAGLAVGHSFSVTFAYDIPRTRALRSLNFGIAERLSRHVSDDSLLFAQHPDSVYTLSELRDRVRIALPLRDGFRDFRRLASFHARAGRRVYAAFSAPVWRALADGQRLHGLELTPLAKAGGFELYELREGERFAGVAHSPSWSR
jgi:hypothetical protein